MDLASPGDTVWHDMVQLETYIALIYFQWIRSSYDSTHQEWDQNLRANLQVSPDHNCVPEKTRPAIPAQVFGKIMIHTQFAIGCKYN